MTLSVEGWIDWAKRVDGVPDKVYTQKNAARAFACHSVVGEETEFQDGIPNRFLDTSKNADGSYTDYAAASVQFVLRKSGLLIQMYPIWASTWTSGGREANTTTMSMEAEGGLNPYTEPLTPNQVATFRRLMIDLRPVMGMAKRGVTLYQHKDLAKKYGYAPTACASDRYNEAWTLAEKDTQEEEWDMTKEEREEHQWLVAIMGGRDKLKANFERGNDFILGYALEQEKLGKHIADKSLHKP